MATRFIRQQQKCACCGHWRTGHMTYHENARGFVDKRCLGFLNSNPDYKKLHFKGWVWIPKKENQHA